MQIIPMDHSFIVYRCLHVGLLSAKNIDEKGNDEPVTNREQYGLNRKFFRRLIATYGSCAMLAIEKDYVVGYARFYPDIIYHLSGKKHMCCQDVESGISPEMVNMDLPVITALPERVLRISCWFIHKDYRNRGLSHSLLQGIIDWARSSGWEKIRATAAVDNHWVASQACALMLRTYEKFSFKQVDTCSSPELLDYLLQMQRGKFGTARQQELQKYCSGQEISNVAVYHRVESIL